MTEPTPQEIVERLLEEQVASMDLQAKNFLKKNNIPFTTIEETQQLLRDKGYRLIDEVTIEDDGKRHTYLLVKVIDQTSYKIKNPTWEQS